MQLELRSCSLTGSIPAFDSAMFSDMNYLDMSSNSLSGPVASSTLSTLTQLSTLNI